MSRELSALIAVACACLLALSVARSDDAAGAPARAVDTAAPRKPKTIKLAITIDDLPGGGLEVLGYTHVQMVKDIIATLRAHRAPDATGFIVGGMIESRPARYEALDAWVKAGFTVGNHSYSHDRIAELGLTRYMDDIVKNRSVVDPLEKRSGQGASYFRFPYLEEGATPDERRALSGLLTRERYTLVRASVAFSDTDWADAYLRCLDKRDKEALAALDRSYLLHALDHLHWSVAAADHVFGQPIPHVLLLHVNVPTANNLDALLTMYEAQGVELITLEEAMREPAYTVHYDSPGGDLLSQASRLLARPYPPKPADFDVINDRFCR